MIEDQVQQLIAIATTIVGSAYFTRNRIETYIKKALNYDLAQKHHEDKLDMIEKHQKELLTVQNSQIEVLKQKVDALTLDLNKKYEDISKNTKETKRKLEKLYELCDANFEYEYDEESDESPKRK